MLSVCVHACVFICVGREGSARGGGGGGGGGVVLGGCGGWGLRKLY